MDRIQSSIFGKSSTRRTFATHSSPIPRNPGVPFDLGTIEQVRVNKPATLRRAATLGARRSLKKNWQAAWLLRAVTCIDLTTLSGDDTPSNVQRLCAKASNPVDPTILDALDLPSDVREQIHCAAVCVYPARVQDAVTSLATQDKDINVASVATGFPSGQIPTDLKLLEIQRAVEDGATEIDIVVSRAHALTGRWDLMYEEVSQFREACGPAHMKAILATGELATLANIAKASITCMQAGSDFIKTSTGKEPVNATLEASLVMTRCIREYYESTGYMVGYKPAGGISSAKDALVYLALMKEELGDEWLNQHLFRFGASSLLTDIERQLHHNAFGEYANSEYLAMA